MWKDEQAKSTKIGYCQECILAALMSCKRWNRYIPTSCNFDKEPAIDVLFYPQSVLLFTSSIIISSAESDEVFAKWRKLRQI